MRFQYGIEKLTAAKDNRIKLTARDAMAVIETGTCPIYSSEHHSGRSSSRRIIILDGVPVDHNPATGDYEILR